LEAERLDDEIVQDYIKFIQDHLEFLVGIHYDEDADYVDPIKISLSFSFLKKKVKH